MSANAEKEETEKSENREKRNQSYQEYVKKVTPKTQCDKKLSESICNRWNDLPAWTDITSYGKYTGAG